MKKGDQGQNVRALQLGLNALGYNLDTDGYYGPDTESVVKDFQKENKLLVDGVAGTHTQELLREKSRRVDMAITANPLPIREMGTVTLSPAGEKLLLDYEVGGGRAYYEKKLQYPTVPPESSGMTIGIGYDLGYATRERFIDDWFDALAFSGMEKFLPAIGKIRDQARACLPAVKDIKITWEDAYQVFLTRTVPKYYREAAILFPGFARLHPDAQAALVSLVFNRGTSLRGARRREMKEIVDILSDGVQKSDYPAMVAAIRRMKRLFPDTRGLIFRREAEAQLIEKAGKES